MLVSLVLAASGANMNLAVAIVALLAIGKAFDTSQTVLNVIAVGYRRGPAGSVLYLGAVGDRYGRKLMLLVGSACSISVSVLVAYAPNPGILVLARVLGSGVGRDSSSALPDRIRAPTRVEMASGTADLQRDLGGALMQSILGALLTAGYPSAQRRDRNLRAQGPDHDGDTVGADQLVRQRVRAPCQAPAVLPGPSSPQPRPRSSKATGGHSGPA